MNNLEWKSELQAKIAEIYHDIHECVNRYEAALLVVKQIDSLVELVLPGDTVLAKMVLGIDDEFLRNYLETMSELQGKDHD